MNNACRSKGGKMPQGRTRRKRMWPRCQTVPLTPASLDMRSAIASRCLLGFTAVHGLANTLPVVVVVVVCSAGPARPNPKERHQGNGCGYVSGFVDFGVALHSLLCFPFKPEVTVQVQKCTRLSSTIFLICTGPGRRVPRRGRHHPPNWRKHLQPVPCTRACGRLAAPPRQPPKLPVHAAGAAASV